MPDPELTAVILSGGASRRMGQDKAALELDGVPLLERTAAAVRAAGAARIVVAGPPLEARGDGGHRPADRVPPSPAPADSVPADSAPSAVPADSALAGARYVREDPPRSGPVAALEAALALVETRWMLLVPCDLARPEAACRELVSGARGPDGVVAVDATGHRQHLTALLDTAAVRATARPGTTRVRERLAGLDLAERPEPPGAPGLWDDMDTPDDVARVRAGRGAAVTGDRDNEVPGLREWMSAVVAELGLPEDVVVPSPLLDAARDVANTVVRPGAPMSTYLIGVALGLQLAAADAAPGAGTATAERVHELAARVRDLAARYDAGPGGGR